MKTIFFLLIFSLTVSFQNSYALDPLIDTPGKTIGSDFNGDGIHDFIVGANLNNDGGTNNEGAAYIFFGSSSLSGTKDLGAIQSADVTILGKGTSDNLGRNVSSAGDVNGDGFDDIIVGAFGNDDGGTDDEGAAYIFFGASDLSGTKSLGGSRIGRCDHFREGGK